MVDFENYEQQGFRICSQIERNMIALGMDWRDESVLVAISHDALGVESVALEETDSRRKILRHELRGMIELMTRTIEEAANHGVEIHGNDMWEALMKVMWSVKEGTPR